MKLEQSPVILWDRFYRVFTGLSDHIDVVVKSGCVYSYYVNKRLYSSNMDAI